MTIVILFSICDFESLIYYSSFTQPQGVSGHLDPLSILVEKCSLLVGG